MKQRLTGIAALLAIGALMAGVPWLFVFVVARVRIRFDLATPQGWWQAISTPDDGTLLIWVLTVLGALAWAVLVIAIMVEIVSRLRHVAVPHLRGFGIPQAMAHSLVAAAIGAVLATNTVSSIPATAAPEPLPVDAGGPPSHATAAPAARPGAHHSERKDADHYVVKKGDTLWDIADDKLGNPLAYPKIFKASRHTVQPDGRHLVDPDLIYVGWKLTIPDGDQPDKPIKRHRADKTDVKDGAAQHSVLPKTAPEPVPPTPMATVPTQPPADQEPTSATDAPEADQPPPADEDEHVDHATPLPWMLAGLSGAGALLAGGLWLWLRRRRAAQFRFRRPGRTITVPDEPALAVVEKTLMHQGDITSDLVDRIDQTTQRLAANLLGAGKEIPTLLGIDVTYEHLTFRFTDPIDLPVPWEPGDDRREWRILTTPTRT